MYNNQINSNTYYSTSDVIIPQEKGNSGNIILRITFTDHTRIEHIIPVSILSILSYAANRQLNGKNMQEILDIYFSEFDHIMIAYNDLYTRMGLDILKSEYIIPEGDI